MLCDKAVSSYESSDVDFSLSLELTLMRPYFNKKVALPKVKKLGSPIENHLCTVYLPSSPVCTYSVATAKQVHVIILCFDENKLNEANVPYLSCPM